MRIWNWLREKGVLDEMSSDAAEWAIVIGVIMLIGAAFVLFML